MIPVLYGAHEIDTPLTAFTTNGLGALSDTIRCDISEEKNGAYELELDYPMDGIHFEDIQKGCYILAKPNDVDDPQPFEVYKRSAPLDEMVTFYAQHISYRMKHIPIMNFNASSAQDAIGQLASGSLESNPFTFSTTITSSNSFDSGLPRTVRDVLGGSEPSIISVYGGELHFDKFAVELKAHRGKDKDSTDLVHIIYSKNLQKLKDDTDDSEIVTGVLPYWSKENNTGERTTVTGTVVYSDHATEQPYHKTTVVDFSSSFTDPPTVDQLQEVAQKYLNESVSGVTKQTIQVSFIALWQTEEYKNIANLERVNLCDYVVVEYPKLNMNIKKQVISTEYDVLKERYLSLTLSDESDTGNTTLAGTIVNINNYAQEKNKETFSYVERILDYATKVIQGGLGGYVVQRMNDEGFPAEIVVGNNKDIAQMTKCIRINQNGIGFSNGYNATMKIALTLNDGTINGECIKAGSINADAIKANSITVEQISEGAKTEIVSGVQENIDLVDAKLAEQTSNLQLKNFVKITTESGSGSVTIGGTQSNTLLKLINNKVAFTDQTGNVDNATAYISDRRFFTEALQIGRYMIANDDGLTVTLITNS